MGLLQPPGQPQRFGLLSQDMQGLLQRVATMPAAAPAAAPQRNRVSGWRVFDRVLGGQTVSEGLDAERAREQAEALRPEMEAREAAIRAFAAQRGPVAMAALATNPAKFGEAMASNLEGYTLGAGGVRGGIDGQVASAPTFSTVNDTIYRNDPGAGTSTATATAPAAFSDQTARFNAENPVLSAGSTWVGPDGQPRAQGYIAPNVTNLAPGGEAIVTDAAGNVTNRVGSTQPRPLPDAIRVANEKDQTQISDREATTARVENVIGLIDNGMLNLGPADRASAWLRNSTNNSSPQSRALVEARRTVETLRNNILNDATGPQTDGDSLRALNQIIDGWGDEKVVREGLAAYVQIQRRKTETQRRIMEQRAAGYGGPSAPGAASGAASGGAPVTVSTPQEAAALPPGTRYRNPQGQEYIR